MNRDTANTTQDLWNSDHSQDVDATLDHRLLTADGRAEIAYEAEHFGENVQAIAQNISSALDEDPFMPPSPP